MPNAGGELLLCGLSQVRATFETVFVFNESIRECGDFLWDVSTVGEAAHPE
jgi:hypothetical protein